MFGKKVFFVACLFPLLGCAQARRLDFSYAGSERGYSQALEAAEAWRGCGAEVYVSRDPGGIPLAEIESANGRKGSEEGWTNKTTWLGSESVDDVYFLAGEDVRAIVAHEMGHALGLHHSAEGIMRFNSPLEEPLLSSDDCDRFRALETM